MAKKQPQPQQTAVSFDAIIQSGNRFYPPNACNIGHLTSVAQPDRRKKQNEQLANQILGKNRNEKGRRASAPGPGAVSKTPNSKPGSLASRIGMPKVMPTSSPKHASRFHYAISNVLPAFCSDLCQSPPDPARPTRSPRPNLPLPQHHPHESPQSPQINVIRMPRDFRLPSSPAMVKLLFVQLPRV